MPGGLLALLDDVAAMAKVAAASLDDVAGAAAKAGSKAAGVVIDDTAVTPGYVIGFTPDRELPIIGKIALGSLRNKLVILLPAALALGALAPWAITPLLLLGGAFLCFEGAEKILHAFHDTPHDEAAPEALDAAALEARQVAGAVRTDFILSAEIMAIALAELAGKGLFTQAVTLIVVALALTIGVYGVVALIVKLDDIGLHLARRPATRTLGRGLVATMPVLLRILSVVGTAAMLWVGGGIVIHALAGLGAPVVEEVLKTAEHAAAAAVPGAGEVMTWLVHAGGSALFAALLGALIVAALKLVPGKRAAH
ncbi:DUF808 domain-containing protein [Sphingomonas sp.]|uniref:DUF808 domain-containing protein n=1 Tax=Sphingomonas sp. TaxID=28214 RepID=UPI001DF3E12B|nr:DUF808 domain-containing protein [Sphingomonas sp.]MBX9796947.1 DUF808 domain-containing protein [Sphingomonas sp.]